MKVLRILDRNKEHKDLAHALGLEKGENVLITVEDNGFKIVPA